MGKHIVTLQMEELGQKHSGRDQFCHVGGRRGNKKLHLGLALGWELEERRMCWVRKKKAGERHSRQRQQPEQRLRGGAEQGLCTIQEGRKLLQPDCKGTGGYQRPPTPKGMWLDPQGLCLNWCLILKVGDSM